MKEELESMEAESVQSDGGAQVLERSKYMFGISAKGLSKEDNLMGVEINKGGRTV